MDLRRWVYTRVTESLPTGKGEWRGLLAILRNEPSADKPYIALDDGSGTVSWEEIVTTGTLPSIAIEEADTVVVASASVIDFAGDAFNVTNSPAGEANIAMNFGTGAGQPAEGNHTHTASLIVQEGDATVDSAVGTIDFDGSAFNVTSSPAGEVNVIPAFGTGAGQVAEGNHTHTYTVTVQEGDATVDAAVSTLDFDGTAFNVTSSPAGEANIAMAFGTGAGQPAEGSHTHDTFVPFVRLAFNDTGGSTSSTTTYATVISSTFTLPSGTWTVEVNAWGRIGNDASGTVDLRVTIDGTDGSVYTRTAPSTGAYPGGAASSKASVASGSRTALLGIKSTTTGTSTMTNVHMIVNAYRTA